jgi:hypothetical protein
VRTGKSEILFAALYRSPGRNWSDADITELLSFRNKCISAGDMNAEDLFWNSTISNLSDQKILQLCDVNDFETSSPQCQLIIPLREM